jgi:hypothetical protein
MEDLNELIDFLNDDWERRDPDPVEELAEDLGAFLQDGGELTKPLSFILNSGLPNSNTLNSNDLSRNRSIPNYTLC